MASNVRELKQMARKSMDKPNVLLLSCIRSNTLHDRFTFSDLYNVEFGDPTSEFDQYENAHDTRRWLARPEDEGIVQDRSKILQRYHFVLGDQFAIYNNTLYFNTRDTRDNGNDSDDDSDSIEFDHGNSSDSSGSSSSDSDFWDPASTQDRSVFNSFGCLWITNGQRIYCSYCYDNAMWLNLIVDDKPVWTRVTDRLLPEIGPEYPYGVKGSWLIDG